METIVTLTENALDVVGGFIKEQGVGKDAGLRVSILPGGCSGFQYGLNVVDGPDDED